MRKHENLNNTCSTTIRRKQMKLSPHQFSMWIIFELVIVAVLITDQSFSAKAFSVVPTRYRHHNKIPMSLSMGTSIDANTISSQQQPQQDKTNQVDELWNQGRSSTSMKILQQYQRDSSTIVQSFVPGEAFNPPTLLSNNHVQTIGGYFAREIFPEMKYVKKNDWISSFVNAAESNIRRREQRKEDGASILRESKSQHENEDNVHHCPPSFWDERERIETPDGDWFHADYKYYDGKGQQEVEGPPSPLPRSPQGLVILLHGFESNSESPLSKEMANGYSKLGLDVACLNFRGCSGTPNDSLMAYHLGFTDDLRHFLSLVKSRHCGDGNNDENMPHIYLSGFSFGSNVVLKALGELGESAIDEYGIQGAALASAPLDLTSNQLTLEAPGFTRQVYGNNMFNLLKAKMQYKFETCCNGNKNTDKFDYPRAMSATTISELEDAYIAPIYGFDSYLDYYKKSSSIYFLDGIAVPTLIANAKDDPFFDPNVWPVDKSCEGGGNAPIKLIHSEKGGHLGFLFHQIECEDELLHLQSDPLSPSWCSAECARFIDHVHSSASC